MPPRATGLPGDNDGYSKPANVGEWVNIYSDQDRALSQPLKGEGIQNFRLQAHMDSRDQKGFLPDHFEYYQNEQSRRAILDALNSPEPAAEVLRERHSEVCAEGRSWKDAIEDVGEKVKDALAWLGGLFKDKGKEETVNNREEGSLEWPAKDDAESQADARVPGESQRQSSLSLIRSGNISGYAVSAPEKTDSSRRSSSSTRRFRYRDCGYIALKTGVERRCVSTD